MLAIGFCLGGIFTTLYFAYPLKKLKKQQARLEKIVDTGYAGFDIPGLDESTKQTLID